MGLCTVQHHGGPGYGGHGGGKMNACAQKPPHKFFRYSEADLQSGVSIMLVESRKLEHFYGVVRGISF
jgi:hypothetical protein